MAREGDVVLYMVIETYTHGPGPVYARASERGRMLPPRTCTDFAELSGLGSSTPPQVLGISLQSTSECGVAA